METLKLRNKLLEERIESQERKITALDLGRKVSSSGGSDKLLRELEKMSDKEKECQKERHRLEEENLKLRMRIDSPRMEKCAEIIEAALENGEVRPISFEHLFP